MWFGWATGSFFVAGAWRIRCRRVAIPLPFACAEFQVCFAPIKLSQPFAMQAVLVRLLCTFSNVALRKTVVQALAQRKSFQTAHSMHTNKCMQNSTGKKNPAMALIECRGPRFTLYSAQRALLYLHQPQMPSTLNVHGI